MYNQWKLGFKIVTGTQAVKPKCVLGSVDDYEGVNSGSSERGSQDLSSNTIVYLEPARSSVIFVSIVNDFFLLKERYLC